MTITYDADAGSIGWSVGSNQRTGSSTCVCSTCLYTAVFGDLQDCWLRLASVCCCFFVACSWRNFAQMHTLVCQSGCISRWGLVTQ
eukprot:COSAG01_NODE_6180_length_3806_cov_35.350958_6_plen_86_part_00